MSENTETKPTLNSEGHVEDLHTVAVETFYGRHDVNFWRIKLAEIGKDVPAEVLDKGPRAVVDYAQSQWPDGVSIPVRHRAGERLGLFPNEETWKIARNYVDEVIATYGQGGEKCGKSSGRDLRRTRIITRLKSLGDSRFDVDVEKQARQARREAKLSPEKRAEREARRKANDERRKLKAQRRQNREQAKAVREAIKSETKAESAARKQERAETREARMKAREERALQRAKDREVRKREKAEAKMKKAAGSSAPAKSKRKGAVVPEKTQRVTKSNSALKISESLL